MKKLKNDRGITLASLAIYIISMLIALAILATVTAYFKSNFKEMNKNTTDIAEWDKFNLYFLDEVKKTGNDINPVIDPSVIEFVNIDGSINRYEYKQNDKAIYLIKSSGEVIKIAQNISFCEFIPDYTTGKTVITVNMTIGSDMRSQNYVLGTGIAGNYEEENNYTRRIPEIGDYVEYTPDLTTASYEVQAQYATSDNSVEDIIHYRENLSWRILDIAPDGTHIKLISAAPTTLPLTLQGANGYNNGVRLINEICAIYGGSIGTAQGIKIEDIEKYMTYDYHKYTNSRVDTGFYEGTAIYTSFGYRFYPNIFAEEKTGWVDGAQGTELDLSEQNAFVTGNTQAGGTGIKVTQTYFGRMTSSTDWSDSIYQTLLINNGSNLTYWISSRCVDATTSYATFYVRCVSSGGVYGGHVYDSGDRPYSYSYGVRPVVTLDYDIQIDMNQKPIGETSPTNTWKLK